MLRYPHKRKGSNQIGLRNSGVEDPNVLIDNTGDVVIRAIKFTNSNEGFNKLLTTIQDKLGDLSNIEVAMEATGHYWLSLYSALTDNNFNVSVYNPYQVKSYRGAYNNRKQKNDIIDSIIIADYLRVLELKNPNYLKKIYYL